jgi:hypothetical protein
MIPPVKYYRRGRRWAKVSQIAGPVDQSPYQYAVALGFKRKAVGGTVELTVLRRDAEIMAKDWIELPA